MCLFKNTSSGSTFGPVSIQNQGAMWTKVTVTFTNFFLNNEFDGTRHSQFSCNIAWDTLYVGK